MNCTFNIIVWPGSNLTGGVIPDNVNPSPVALTALIVTGAVPTDVKVKDWVADEFTRTKPKAMLVELKLRVAAAVFGDSPVWALLRIKKAWHPERATPQIAIASKLEQ